MAALLMRFAGRILDIDALVAERWGRLTAALPAGIKLPVIDCFIAATALQNNVWVVTRNEADFKNAGIRVINPFTV